MQPANELGRLKLPASAALRRRRAQVVDQRRRRAQVVDQQQRRLSTGLRLQYKITQKSSAKINCRKTNLRSLHDVRRNNQRNNRRIDPERIEYLRPMLKALSEDTALTFHCWISHNFRYCIAAPIFCWINTPVNMTPAKFWKRGTASRKSKTSETISLPDHAWGENFHEKSFTKEAHSIVAAHLENKLKCSRCITSS